MVFSPISHLVNAIAPKAFLCCLLALTLVAEIGCVSIPAGSYRREILEPGHPGVEIERRLVIGLFPGVGASWAEEKDYVGMPVPLSQRMGELSGLAFLVVLGNGALFFIPTLIGWFAEPFSAWEQDPSACQLALVGFCKVGLWPHNSSASEGGGQVPGSGVGEADEEKNEAVERGLRALFGEEVEISRYQPEAAYGYGFAVLLPDGRQFKFEVTEEYWGDHTPGQLADKMGEDELRERLKNSSYKWHVLSNAGFMSERPDWQ